MGADVAQKPSGLALHEGILYLSDNLTGTLFAFDTLFAAFSDAGPWPI